MEKKTKHRILGILVVIGLIIILLPFFDNNELPSQEVLIKAPAFPEQTTSDLANADQPAIPTTATPVAQSSEVIKQQPDETIPANQPLVATIKVPDMNLPQDVPAAPRQEIASNTQETEQKSQTVVASNLPTKAGVEKISREKIAPQEVAVTKSSSLASNHRKPINAIPRRFAKIKPFQTPIDTNGLARLKNPVWVIQIGSFSNKENALRLVNQLRTNGYRAFIQDVSTALGANTRVFVGPIVKQTSARALALQLETDMHIRGMVISYKPLML